MRYKKTVVAMVLVLALALSLVATIGLSTSPSGADAASLVVEYVPGPPTLPGQLNSATLPSRGYEQSEFFITGTADAYSPKGELTEDGLWKVKPIAQEEYTTRIVVNRPIDPEDFNGTVIVEWFNVSGMIDSGPVWMQGHVELVRRGYAWVGVSAQYVGVTQLKMCEPCCPIDWPPCYCTNPQLCPGPGNPLRYADLNHPGDSYSYDIFSQAGQAIRDSADVVLGGLEPERLIAVGESQSAGRLVTYINAAHPVAKVYDGFLVYSRGSQGSNLTQWNMGRIDTIPSGLPDVETPLPTYIRGDLKVPVMVFQAEGDARGLLARQDDTDKFRLWEVAGNAHFDSYGILTSATDVGERESVAEWFNLLLDPTQNPHPQITCESPINNGPATFVLRAGIAHLNRWITDGTLPPEADRLQTISLDEYPYYEVDENGNVLGGIRTPAVDAPVAILSGFGQSGTGQIGQFCRSFGTTTPFTQEKLDELYSSHLAFSSAWTFATLDAFSKGFLVLEDAWNLIVVGAESTIPELPTP